MTVAEHIERPAAPILERESRNMNILGSAEAARRLSQALQGRMNIPPEKIEPSLGGWELFDVRGAVVMRKGAELHAAAPVDVRGRWITRAGIRSIVVDTLQKFGHVITEVMRDNTAGHAFVRRMGFAPLGESDSGTKYILLECRHA